MNIYLNSALMTFLMVAVSLTLISLALQGLKVLALAAEKRSAAAEDREDQELGTELAVVLAAAAHSALGRNARIRRIHVHHKNEDELWSREGRVDIMHSHRVEPKR